MLDWSKVRFADCRLCSAMLDERDLARPLDGRFDLCAKCQEKCRLWHYRRAGWDSVSVVADNDRRRKLGALTVAQANEAWRQNRAFADLRDPQYPFKVGDHIAVCKRPEFWRVLESIDVTDWIRLQLEKIAAKRRHGVTSPPPKTADAS